LIDEEMAEDAFSWELETALHDSKIRHYLAEQRALEDDFFDGVLEMARAWGIEFAPIAPTAHASSNAATPGIRTK
jgi:hypothetical protein